MRHSASATLLALLVAGALASCKDQKAASTGAGNEAAVPPAASMAPAADTAPAKPVQLDLDSIAARAHLDAAAKGKIAPHVAAMNSEILTLHDLTGQVSGNLPAAQKDSIHKALNQHFAAFSKHREEAAAALPPAQKAAFDSAVDEQMHARRTMSVGNPHSKLPSMHPKLNSQGGAADTAKKK